MRKQPQDTLQTLSLTYSRLLLPTSRAREFLDFSNGNSQVADYTDKDGVVFPRLLTFYIRVD